MFRKCVTVLAGIFRSARLETRSRVARLTLPRNFVVSGAEFAENRLISLVEMIGHRIHGVTKIIVLNVTENRGKSRKYEMKEI